MPCPFLLFQLENLMYASDDPTSPLYSTIKASLCTSPLTRARVARVQGGQNWLNSSQPLAERGGP